MRVIFKVLLILEFVLAFFPVVYLWILSLIVFPASVIGMFHGGKDAFVASLMTILGGLGIWGIIQLLIKILNPELPISRPKHIVVYIASGILALIIAAIIMQPSGLKNLVMFLLPAVVTLHFVYLKKGYFKSVANK